ncbi:MAG TPA: hypothetical protein VFE56_07685 [Candidatus Binataceae bacterium]|nr:hypothetical protein [Candidatus Binataceae bacterium]
MKFRSRNANAGGCLWLTGRRVFYALTALAVWSCLVVAGCSQPPAAPSGPDPKAAAEAYLTALKTADYQTCYRMLAESDLVHGSLDEFLSDVPMAPNADRRWFRQLEGATSYQVGPAISRGSEAIVPVNVITPNLVLWERMLGAGGASKELIQASTDRQLYDANYPRLSYPDQIVLVKEGEEWHVLAGFAQRARIADLREQALDAYHEFDYNVALSIYPQILDRLNKAAFTGRGAIRRAVSAEMKAVEAARANAPAAQAYLPKLIVKNVAAKPAQSGASGLFGKVTNAGERAVDQVELTVTYYADNGKPIYSERHTPIALPLEFTDFDLPMVPLRPGETRDFGFALKASPQIQQQGKPRAAVSGVIFSDAVPTPPKLTGAGVKTSHRQAGNEPQPSSSVAASPAPAATPGLAKEDAGVHHKATKPAPETGSAVKKARKKSRQSASTLP